MSFFSTSVATPRPAAKKERKKEKRTIEEHDLPPSDRRATDVRILVIVRLYFGSRSEKREAVRNKKLRK